MQQQGNMKPCHFPKNGCNEGYVRQNKPELERQTPLVSSFTQNLDLSFYMHVYVRKCMFLYMDICKSLR